MDQRFLSLSISLDLYKGKKFRWKSLIPFQAAVGFGHFYNVYFNKRNPRGKPEFPESFTEPFKKLEVSEKIRYFKPPSSGGKFCINSTMNRFE